MSRRHYKVSGGGLLPAGYAECEYIENTGSQWIDTGIKLNPQIEWYLDVQWLKFNSVNAFGVENWQEPAPIIRITNDNRSNPVLGINIVYGDTVGGQYIAYNSYNLSVDRTTFLMKNGHQFINDIEVSQGVMTTTELNWSVIYFATRGNEKIQYNCKRARHYYSYFKEDNMTIKEFIPSLRLSDNKPGLYDLCGSICPLTGTPFYINAGTGEFLYQLKS